MAVSSMAALVSMHRVAATWGALGAQERRRQHSPGAAGSAACCADGRLRQFRSGTTLRKSAPTVRRNGVMEVCALSSDKRDGRDSATLKAQREEEELRVQRLRAPSDEGITSQATAARELDLGNNGNESTSVSGPRDRSYEESGHDLEAAASKVPHSNRTGSVQRKKGSMLFGVEMSPDTVAIAMVYFVQGILGLSRLAVSFFLKDDLHLDPAETAFLSGFSALPWLIKPLYGFISDGVPLFGYRRRSYLVLCGLLGALCWGSLALFVDNKYAAITTILLSSLSVAFSDVVVDSMVVERARGESQGAAGSLQSLCWGSSAAGGIISAYFSGYLVQMYGTRFVFGVTAILPLITSAVGGLVREEPSHASGHGESGVAAPAGFVETSKSQLQFLWETVKEPNIFLPTLFIFLWQATPTSDTAMFFFTTEKLGFGPEFLGRVRLVTAVASLVGVGVYNSYLKDVPLRKIFLWTTLLGAALGATQLLLVTGVNRSLGVSDEWFAMGDSLVLTVLGQVSFMPILVLAARLCPPGVEATLFATLMSITNGGGVTGGFIGAGLTQVLGVTSQNFENLALLVVLCNASSLLPLPFLGLLPSESELEAAVEKAERTLDSLDKSSKEE